MCAECSSQSHESSSHLSDRRCSCRPFGPPLGKEASYGHTEEGTDIRLLSDAFESAMGPHHTQHLPLLAGSTVLDCLLIFHLERRG